MHIRQAAGWWTRESQTNHPKQLVFTSPRNNSGCCFATCLVQTLFSPMAKIKSFSDIKYLPMAQARDLPPLQLCINVTHTLLIIIQAQLCYSLHLSSPKSGWMFYKHPAFTWINHTFILSEHWKNCVPIKEKGILISYRFWNENKGTLKSCAHSNT